MIFRKQQTKPGEDKHIQLTLLRVHRLLSLDPRKTNFVDGYMINDETLIGQGTNIQIKNEMHFQFILDEKMVKKHKIMVPAGEMSVCPATKKIIWNL